MRSPRLRDTDGTAYDPETGERLASHEAPPDEAQAALPPPDETVAALADITATLAAGQRSDDLGITEEQWEELRVSHLECGERAVEEGKR